MPDRRCLSRAEAAAYVGVSVDVPVHARLAPLLRERLEEIAQKPAKELSQKPKRNNGVVGKKLAEEITPAKGLDTGYTPSPALLVPSPTGKPWAYRNFAWDADLAAAGITGRQRRDLRLTLATALGAAGCSEDQIRSITGHKTREILTTYVVPDTGFARGAMKRLQDAGRAQSRTDARKRSSLKLNE